MSKLKGAFFLYFFVSIAGFAYLGYLFNESNQQVNKTQKKLEAEISKQKTESSLSNKLISLIKIDNELILNDNYELAFELYQDFNVPLPDSIYSFIEKRKEKLSRIFEENQNENTQIAILQNRINKGNKKIDTLKNEIEALKLKFDFKRDSLSNYITELKVDLKNKDQKLNQKEKVRVITFKSTSGKKIHYLGEVEDDKANGGGVGIWETGSLYRGNWKDNVRHGKGIFEWADGQKYDGDYKDGKRHGTGTYFWPSGERYEGEWVNDKRNGMGTLYDPDSNIRYKGEWVDDKPVSK
jgi:hypothetical protein